MNALASVAPRVVRYHPPVGLSTLFKPLPKRGERPPLAVTYQPKEGGPILKFSAKAALGIPEQTLLLVLLELAQEHFSAFQGAVVLNAGAKSEVGQVLWMALNNNDERALGQTVKLSTTWYELNRRCNTETGGSAQELRIEQLRRLCEVVVWEISTGTDKTVRQSFLVVMLVSDENRIHLALNCRLASSLFGQPYAQVSLQERLELDKDIPMALHAFFSTTLSCGHHLKIKVETLIERLWPGSSEGAPEGTHRRRRNDVKVALKALGRLDNWSVEWERDGLACVTRSSSGVRDMTRIKANKCMAYPEQAFAKIPNKNNEIRTFDASVLFLNKNTGA